MTNKLEDYLPLDGLGGTYSEEQARQAIANAEAAANINPGGGGGSVSVSNFPSTFAATQSGVWTVSTGISQPLTDTQLRATPVPVSVSNFPSTFAATQSGVWTVSTGISQPLTDTQLRATPVPVSMTTAPAGLAYVSTATITRAANQTPYTANDVYGGVFQLQNIGASGGFVFISSIEIIFNITAVPSGMSAFALYLYSSSPPSAITDNLPFSLGSTDTPSCLTPGGIIFSASLARGGGSVVAEVLNINRLIKLAPSSTSLRGYLVTLGAFTPAANSETATITMETFAP